MNSSTKSLAKIQVKPYKKRLRMHKDAVVYIHSSSDQAFEYLISGSEDGKFLMLNLKLKKKQPKEYDISYPSQSQLKKFWGKDDPEVQNLSREHILNNEKNFVHQKSKTIISSIIYDQDLKYVYSGYENGLICIWDIENEELVQPMSSHTNAITQIVFKQKDLFSSSIDCTIRMWNKADQLYECSKIFKFSDPVEKMLWNIEENMLICATWDSKISFLEIDSNEITSSFKALEGFIKDFIMFENQIFVCGTDTLIKSFDIKIGDQKDFVGHTGIVLVLGQLKNKYLISGSDDFTIRFWDIKSTKCVEELKSHYNAVVSFGFLQNYLFSGSMDHHIICWDLDQISCRIIEREMMLQEELLSKKFEVYQNYIDARTKKKKGKAKKGTKGGKKGKK